MNDKVLDDPCGTELGAMAHTPDFNGFISFVECVIKEPVLVGSVAYKYLEFIWDSKKEHQQNEINR